MHGRLQENGGASGLMTLATLLVMPTIGSPVTCQVGLLVGWLNCWLAVECALQQLRAHARPLHHSPAARPLPPASCDRIMQAS